VRCHFTLVCNPKAESLAHEHKELICDFEKRGRKERSTVIGTKTKIVPVTVLLNEEALSVARTAVDTPTQDLLTQRLIAHEKAAWMLRSMLAEERPLYHPAV
jgi:DNA-binding ferritin-like protein